MAFQLPDSWVWDFWVVDDGEQYHLFFLYASRALGDPELRHHRASIGHAVSADLRSWHRVADALVPSDPPAFDDLATWTGSVRPSSRRAVADVLHRLQLEQGRRKRPVHRLRLLAGPE